MKAEDEERISIAEMLSKVDISARRNFQPNFLIAH